MGFFRFYKEYIMGLFIAVIFVVAVGFLVGRGDHIIEERCNRLLAIAHTPHDSIIVYTTMPKCARKLGRDK